MARRFRADADNQILAANVPSGDATACAFVMQSVNTATFSFPFGFDDNSTAANATNYYLETATDGKSMAISWRNTVAASGTSAVIAVMVPFWWYFMCLRRAGTTLTGYIRRIGSGRWFQQSTTTSGIITPTRFLVGGDAAVFPGEFWNGRVAAPRLWDVALTDSEIFRESYQLAPVTRRHRLVGAWLDQGYDTNGKARNLSNGTSVLEPGPPGIPRFNNQPTIFKRINAPTVIDDSEARLPVPEPEEVDEEVEPRPQEALDAVLSDAPPPPPDDPEVRQWAPEPNEELEEPIAEVTFIAPEAFADGPEARDELEWQEEYDEGLLDASPETTPAQFADGPEARDYVELQEEPDEGWSEPALHPVETSFADGPEAREGAELREEEPDEPTGVEAELIDAQAQAATDDPEARDAAPEGSEEEEPALEQADTMLTAAPVVATDDPEGREQSIEDPPEAQEDAVDGGSMVEETPAADDQEARLPVAEAEEAEPDWPLEAGDAAITAETPPATADGSEALPAWESEEDPEDWADYVASLDEGEVAPPPVPPTPAVGGRHRKPVRFIPNREFDRRVPVREEVVAVAHRAIARAGFGANGSALVRFRARPAATVSTYRAKASAEARGRMAVTGDVGTVNLAVHAIVAQQGAHALAEAIYLMARARSHANLHPEDVTPDEALAALEQL